MNYFSRGIIRRFVVLGMFICAYLLFGALMPKVYATGNISGIVFRDYNASGLQDSREPGIEGVLVTAVDNLGNTVTTTTSTDGSYTISVAGDSARLEFTPPASKSFLEDGASGSSTVQFVDTSGGDVNNVHVGFNNPAQYCQSSPSLSTSCYLYGEQSTNTGDVIVSFDYEAGCLDDDRDGACDDAGSYDTPYPAHIASGTDVGTTWGMAYDRTNDALYAASFMKRHSGFGQHGATGIIYQFSDVSDATGNTYNYQDVTPDPPGYISYDENTYNCVGSNFFVRTINVPDSFTITDVNFGLALYNDTGRGEVVVILQSPTGTQAVVINTSADANLHYDVYLDDAASPFGLNDGNDDNPFTPYFTRNAVPSNPLAVFNGENASGDWLVAVCDSSANGSVNAYMQSRLVLKSDENPVSISPYVDLDALGFDTGTDPHPQTADTCTSAAQAGNNNNNCWFHDTNSWDAVGKISLGDMDISEDGQTLWTINLFDRMLYAIPVTTTAVNAGLITTYALPTPIDCPASGDIRPFATAIRDYHIYVGIVCTAESTGLATDLRMYVYEMDMNNLGVFTQVLNEPLNYPRGCAQTSGAFCASANWNAWSTTFITTATAFNGEYVHPQPWLTDIDFDNEAMILGLRDRYGDQTGFYSGHTDDTNPNFFTGDSAGDILRACPDGLGGWQLENAASCGSNTSGGAGNGEGPGNGEYYYEEDYPNHQELSVGGLFQVPGFDDIAFTMYDPIFTDAEFFDGGILWLDNELGDRENAFRIYSSDSGGGAGTFAKGGGLGDLEAFCNLAPIELGNRVWLDTNGDGVQDASEPGLANVVVGLYDTTGMTLLVTTTTSANGSYYFIDETDPRLGTIYSNTLPTHYGLVQTIDGGLTPETAYQLMVDLTQSVLQPYTLTVATVDSGVNSGLRDSDATPTGNMAIVNITLGKAGANNHNVDFGFAGYDYGDLPDTGVGTGTGNYNTSSADSGAYHLVSGTYLGSCVDLDSDGQPDNQAGFDAINGDDGGASLGTVSSCDTAGDDEDGIAFITPLIPNVVACIEVTTSAGGVVNGWIDFNDNGILDDTGEQVLSDVAVGAGLNQPASELASDPLCFSVPSSAPALTTSHNIYSRFRLTQLIGEGGDNPTGLATTGEIEDYAQPLMCLGDLVWFDADDSGTVNGIEYGLNGITVELYRDRDGDGLAEPNGDDGAAVDSVVTAQVGGVDGSYSFCGLVDNAYFVSIPSTTFASSGMLYLTTSSTADNAPNTINTEDDDNGTDNGDATTNGIVSVGVLTMTVGTEPTADNNTNDNGNIDNNTNMMLDLGITAFTPMDYGDLPSSYDETDFGSDGARHTSTGLTLGSNWDADNDGNPDASALGDDSNGDDEDGVVFTGSWSDGQAEMDVTASADGCLNAWLDFTDGSGLSPDNDFDDTYTLGGSYSEHAVQNLAVNGGTTAVTFNLPTSIADSMTFNMRVRLTPRDADTGCSSAEAYIGGNATSTGLALGGEVEDYQVSFSPTAIALRSVNTMSLNNKYLILALFMMLSITTLGVFYYTRRKPISAI